jgi:hypothetical protein
MKNKKLQRLMVFIVSLMVMLSIVGAIDPANYNELADKRFALFSRLFGLIGSVVCFYQVINAYRQMIQE